MEWYSGTIRDAVAYSQSKQAVFFVAIFGEDQPSQELEAALNSPEVLTIVSADSFVCIRLIADSEQHRLFADIYANAKASSIYCITDKGVPVEIITTPLPSSELKTRLESALSRHRQVIGLKPAVTPTPTASTSTTQQSATAEAANNSAVPETDNTQLPFEERVRRAKELAAARQLKKQKEEEEEHRRREIERRQAGKGAADLKRWQDEQEAKKLLEERRKDKEEEKALRQRLREQIAQDRAARNAKTNVELVGEQSLPSAPKPSIATTPPANFAGQARLQFRLPNGSSQTHSFSPDSTLGHVRQFLRDNNSIPFREFSIWVAFPRRQFSETDYGTSLRDLDLLPSAALLILPLSGLSMNPAAGRNSGLWALIATLLGFVVYPITLAWSVFQRALPAPAAAPLAPRDKSHNSTPNAPQDDKRLNSMGKGNALGGGNGSNTKDQSTASTSSGASSSAPNNDNSGQAQLRKKSKEKGHSNPTDGIHRLRTTESDSDEEKFYNGNSTQQM